MPDVMKGIKVVEVAQWWFVPAATAILAEWGAEVVKVEHPVTGDPQRAITASKFPNRRPGDVELFIEIPNRGKRGITLDLATPEGVELLYRLVRQADVFATNFLGPARRRLQIDVDDIRSQNPTIVYLRGTGWGARGPDAERGGIDMTCFWARGGVSSVVTPDGSPGPVTLSNAAGDTIGSLAVVAGVASALLKRERTGLGSVVDVSLLNTSMWVIQPDILAPSVMRAPVTHGTRGDAPNPLMNTYQTKDERWIALGGMQTDRYWVQLCECLGFPELATDERFSTHEQRIANRQACIKLLDDAFAARPLDVWQHRLQSLEAPWAPFATAPEVMDDPQVVANGFLVECDRGNGTSFPLVAGPVQFDETPTGTVRRAPEWGEDTDSLLAELGVAPDRILDLKIRGIVN